VWKRDPSAAKGAASERQEGKDDFRPAISDESGKRKRRFLAALGTRNREIAQDGFVAAREMTNEEMREAAQKRRQAAALQSALGINSCAGRGAEEEFLTCIVDSR
jgi:hypothetical protein